MDAETLSRVQFALTASFHFLYPPLSMGLGLMLVVLGVIYVRTRNPMWRQLSFFWVKVYGLIFALGVATGIVQEFEFGMNWADYSRFVGNVFGSLLAAEGVFAFFLESSFLYVLLFGEKKFGPRVHWVSSLLLWIGTWLSGYFIVCTNAWMQHPVGYSRLPDGTFVLESLSALLTNPWALVEYAHTMVGAVLTGFVGAWALEQGGAAMFFGVIAVAMSVCWIALAAVSRHVPAAE